MKNFRTYIYNLVLILILIVFSINLSAKTILQDEKSINEFASVLKQKVLLSEDQETKIINILTELKNNVNGKPENKSSFIKDAQSKIEKLLDSKQKMKYDIIKNDLWKKF
jgi:hypothetical protein